ncbi:MAG: hypothetical protein AB1405_13705, partial [Bdellovibrionota bacterium]
MTDARQRALVALGSLAGEPGFFCAPAGEPLAATAPAGTPSGRDVSIAGARPFARLEVIAGAYPALHHLSGARAGTVEILSDTDPLKALSYALARFSPAEKTPASPPGCVLAISYDAAPWFIPSPPERLPRLKDAPLIIASFYEAVLVSDPITGEMRSAATGFSPSPDSAAYLSQKRLNELGEMLEKTTPVACGLQGTGKLLGTSLEKSAYLSAIARVKEYIAAGDIYQVNLSQRLRVAP